MDLLASLLERHKAAAMKKLILTAFLGFASLAQASSWYYNENGGLGIEQPEGWTVHENGRSARLVGPANDSAQSEIFFGSDWISGVKTDADLKAYLQKENPKAQLEPLTISDRAGYKFGSSKKGQIYILRLPENVIVLEYTLRGSKDQVDEGTEAISSFDIRTQEYQQ